MYWFILENLGGVRFATILAGEWVYFYNLSLLLLLLTLLILDLLRALLRLYRKLGNWPLLSDLLGLKVYALLIANESMLRSFVDYDVGLVVDCYSFMKGIWCFFMGRGTVPYASSLVDYFLLGSLLTLLLFNPHLPMFKNWVVLLKLDPDWSSFLKMFGHEPRS